MDHSYGKFPSRRMKPNKLVCKNILIVTIFLIISCIEILENRGLWLKRNKA